MCASGGLAWWHMDSVLYIGRGKYLVSITWGSSAEGTPQSCSAYVRLCFYTSVFLRKITTTAKRSLRTWGRLKVSDLPESKGSFCII